MTTIRVRWLLIVAPVLALAGCATPVAPPPVVATLPPPPPPPPTMPAGGYAGMEIPDKREDGTFVTPNFRMTDAAAVWHLRGALNVAALACDGAGGGVVGPYNAWLVGHAAGLDRYVKKYRDEWADTGWSDWEAAFDANQTRLYNFYGAPALRVAFCAVARQEIAAVLNVSDADLPAFARGSLGRLDHPFIAFFGAFEKWRDYYEPRVTPPPVVPTLPPQPAPAAAIAQVPVPGEGAAMTADAGAQAQAPTAAAETPAPATQATTPASPPEAQAPMPAATTP
ncbi:hypothetical protein [Sphingomonas beigongshangi]|uniref:hypothetical protein n=1 Tax=Sphingomonas beigongshangi TaxID=2782540 RepID=UPI00193C0F79|nr:hypothetical protein [Sphingomonas beigongshangi]